MKAVASETRILRHLWRFLIPVFVCLSSTAYCAGPTRGAVPTPTDDLRFQLGRVALAPEARPAEFSFQKADGRIQTAGDLAGIAAGKMLNFTTSEPLFNLPISAVTFGLAPGSAGIAALGSRNRLSPAKLSECEADLLSAMREMAAQDRFQNCLVLAAGEKCPGRLASAAEMDKAGFDRRALDAVLDARVEELRLERTGSGDASYALHIRIRTRLVRAVDGAVLYDQPAEFRSGTCLFLDWTSQDAFQRVAETGYRQLADRVVARLLATTDGPLLIGAGYKKPYTPNRKQTVAPMNLAKTDSMSAPGLGGTIAARWDGSLPGSWASDPEPALLPVAESPVAIYSKSTLPHVTLQKPQTRDEAVSEALQDTHEAVGGLENHPNQVLALAAAAVAVPISLWKQSGAIVRGLSSKSVHEGETKLSEAANRAQPHKELALHVVRQMAPRTAQPVMLASLSYSQPASDFPALPIGDDQSSATSHRARNSLEIHVQSASLTGNSDVNPKLTLSVEAFATLRSRDGHQIYSCPVKYRGRERKFTEWAAHDAKKFREELELCYRAMSSALVDQMVHRGVVAPCRCPQTTLAKN